MERNVHLLQILDWQPNHAMFARGRHFRVRTFASIYSSTQDTDYNIKVTRQNWLGLLKQKMETVGCGSCKQYIIG